MNGLGDLNRTTVTLLLVLVLGAGGYLWYSQMYKPAVVARTAAQSSANTAQQGLAAAQKKLEEAKANLEAANSALGKPDDSVARLQLATEAIPNKALLDEAPLTVITLAKRAGVSTTFDAGDDGSGGGDAVEIAGPAGSTPIDLHFTAAGTYGEMMNFMNQLQGTVTVEKGKLHARGRLFNVVALQMGVFGETDGGGDAGDDSDTSPLVIRNGQFVFKLTVRMYMSSTANSQSVGDTTADAATADGTSTDAATADGTSTDGAGTGASTSADTAAGNGAVATGAGTDASATGTDTGTGAADTAAASGSAGGA